MMYNNEINLSLSFKTKLLISERLKLLCVDPLLGKGREISNYTTAIAR
jgi:hypothetical protein